MNSINYPKYSVLMSVYYKENPEWFRSSIASIFAQTVQPAEFILIEDGPLTPELDSVAEQYKSQYPDVFKIVALNKNGGLGPALRLGIEQCSNEFIARMDSDDYCEPNRIEKELEAFRHDPTLGMVGTNVIEFIGSPDNCISKGTHSGIQVLYLKNLLYSQLATIGSTTYLRTTICGCG